MNAATLSRTFLSIALMLILAASLSLAQVPKTISYQGVLTDASGTVVPDGNYNLTFRLYDVATGGTALWAEGQLVAVSKGIFNVILGSVAPLNLPFNKPYYLGVTVGAGAELTPRMPLTSSGYSFRAANADSINGIAANRAAPIAYAAINSDGTVASGTPNVSCSWTGSRYEITIAGESYWYNSYVTVVTPMADSRIARTGSSGGKLLIYIQDLSGAYKQAPFSFVTYKP